VILGPRLWVPEDADEKKYVAQDLSRTRKARDAAGRQLVSATRVVSSRRAMSRSMMILSFSDLNF
jgi:hypothetical protein